MIVTNAECKEKASSCCKNGLLEMEKITVQTLMNVLVTIKALIYVSNASCSNKNGSHECPCDKDMKIFHKETL